MTKPRITATAVNVSATATEVSGAVDVQIELSNGVTGLVTLVREHQNYSWAVWGEPDMWMSAEILEVFTQDNSEQWGEISDEISGVAVAAANAVYPWPYQRRKRDDMKTTKRNIVKADEITTEQLESLRSEAGSGGDMEMVRIVDDALEADGDEQRDALEECRRILQAEIDGRYPD